MDTPQEIEVKYVLPVLRRDLAKALIALGLSQKDAAKKLGITESAVSQYLKKKRGNNELKVPAAEIRKSAKAIASGDRLDAIEEVNRLLGFIKKTKLLCSVHKRYGSPMEKCCVCLK